MLKVQFYECCNKMLLLYQSALTSHEWLRLSLSSKSVSTFNKQIKRKRTFDCYVPEETPGNDSWKLKNLVSFLFGL